MNIVQILFTGFSSLVGILLASVIVSWQHARADRNWQSGRPIRVAASIRRAEGGRWRHGSVDVEGDRVFWTPRTPWGRSVEIGGVAFGSQRSPQGALRFQLPPAAVILGCSEADRSYELAVLPGTIKYLYSAAFAA